jgi:hypothetical protein
MTTGAGLRALALFLLLTGLSTVQAQEDLSQLMAALARVSFSEASYVEHKYLDMLEEPMVRNGRLIYAAPDQLEWSQGGAQYRIEGDEVHIHRHGDTRQMMLDHIPQIRAFIESFRATLSGNEALLRQHYDPDFSPGQEQHWALTLRPRDVRLRQYVVLIHIEGRADRVSRIRIDENSGDWSEMQLETLKLEYHALGS